MFVETTSKNNFVLLLIVSNLQKNIIVDWCNTLITTLQAIKNNDRIRINIMI